MVYFLHGDNLVASRNFLKSLIDQAKNKKLEIVHLDGLSIKPEEFIQAFDSSSLFGDKRLVVVENLFSRTNSREQKQILEYLQQYAGETEIILWEKKEITKTKQKHLPNKTTIKVFKTPALLFKFLDQLIPSLKKQALQTLHELLKTESGELVFYMLIRQIRLLILVADKQKVPGPPWMIGKLKKQSAAYNMSQLLTMYQKLFRIDRSIKTGKSLMPLEWHLDMFIISL